MFWIISILLGLSSQAVLAQDQINPLGSDPGAIAAGSKLYEQICQSCHGGGAAGDRAPSLVTGVFPHGDEDGMIFMNIRRGIPGTQMPSFSGLTSDQIWQVIAYIRSLSGRHYQNQRNSPRRCRGRREDLFRQGRLQFLSRD